MTTGKKKFCRKCTKEAHGPLTCEDNDKKLAGGDVTGKVPGDTTGTGPGGVAGDGKTPGSGGTAGDGKTPGSGGAAGDGKIPGSGGSGGAGGAGGAGGDDNDPTCDCKKKTAASLQDYITKAIYNARGKKFAEDLLNAALFRPCKYVVPSPLLSSPSSPVLHPWVDISILVPKANMC